MVFLQSGKEEKTSPFQKIIDKAKDMNVAMSRKVREKSFKKHMERVKQTKEVDFLI